MVLVRLFSIFSNETLIIESFLMYLLIILSQPLYLFSSGMMQQTPELNASKQLLLKFPVVFKETNISEISYISLITSCLTAPKNLMRC